jgi:iron complex transport system ATP-binding protein
MSALEARGVCLELGGEPILTDVDARVACGEVVALLGPNGAGKSTLLSALTGERRPGAGEVWLGGRDVRGMSPRELALARAVLPQHASLTFPLTASQIVRLGRAPHTSSPAEDARVEELSLRLAGVWHLRERAYDTMSGGERQRVQLARVLAQLLPVEGTSRWLLLDEPTASLDPARALDVLELSRELARRGVGVCVVLHDVNLAARYADRVVVMRGGRVLAEGPPADVFTPETFTRAFDMSVEILHDPRLGHPVVVPLRGEDPFVFPESTTSPDEEVPYVPGRRSA